MTDNHTFRDKLIQRAYRLAQQTILLVEGFPNKRPAWIISDQLIRAITSIAANIIEAQAASSKKDFINFLNHALKSGNEAIFWLQLSKDLNKDLIPELELLIQETQELVKILGSSIKKLRTQN